MKKKYHISRRTALRAAAGSVTAYLLTGCIKKGPPTYGNILRIGDALTYSAQRMLLPGQSLVKEYPRSDISSFPATGTTDPGGSGSRGDHEVAYNAQYATLKENSFQQWQLSVEGKVAKPRSYSLADLKKFAARTQITRHTCEEGWNAIAEWKGVVLADLLQDAGILPSARYINFYAYDQYMESIDMLDAFHPQTILAYEMNGGDLPVPHGAPLRVRVETQIGYKSVKYLQRIVVTDEFVDNGEHGWAWYTGI